MPPAASAARSAVEGAFERDDPGLVRMAARIMVFARRLDRAFAGLRPGIGEEDEIGKGRGDQPLGELLGLRDLEEIGRVPEPLTLRGQRFHEMGMCMAERRHGDAATKIEKALALGRDQPGAFAALKGDVRARIGWKQGRGHWVGPCKSHLKSSRPGDITTT